MTTDSLEVPGFLERSETRTKALKLEDGREFTHTFSPEADLARKLENVLGLMKFGSAVARARHTTEGPNRGCSRASVTTWLSPFGAVSAERFRELSVEKN